MVAAMARYFDVHPENPQPRAISQVVAMLQDGALIAYPTDSGYALGCRTGQHDGTDRIRQIRRLDSGHHFTLVCADFAQLGHLVRLDNTAFRAIKAATPGPYTFILPATHDVPRRLAHPRKKTVGVRIPDSRVTQAILRELGEPLLSSTLILPDSTAPMTDGWQVKEELDHVVDAVVDAGETRAEPTTVVDWSDGYPEVVRVGAGDPARFE
jgi:tRNA threonylcarbamoyl adenosine modification protein (Sua5/YciO/YrdC/YwlC family)